MNFSDGIRIVKTHSSSLSPWILDSGATHIIGNKYFFSSLSTSGYLPYITIKGFRVSSHGVGTIHILPSLSIDNVIYVPNSTFNLLSISRFIRPLIVWFFLPKIMFVYNYKTKVRDKWLAQDVNLMVFITYGHLQMLAPWWIFHLSFMLSWIVLVLPRCSSLSKSLSLSCESCQLGKHSCSSFPSSGSQQASSPFTLVHFDSWGPSHVKSNLEF